MTPRHNALPWLMTLLIELWKTGMVWCYASSTWELWLKALDNTKVFQSFYKRKYIYYIHITLYAVFYFYSYLIDIGCIHTQLYNRKLFNKKTSKNIFNINTCTPFFLSSWWSIDKCLLPNKTRTHFVILFFFSNHNSVCYNASSLWFHSEIKPDCLLYLLSFFSHLHIEDEKKKIQ